MFAEDFLDRAAGALSALKEAFLGPTTREKPWSTDFPETESRLL
jgi:hypothetical protein